MPNKIKELMIEGSSRLKKQKKKTEHFKAAKSGGKKPEVFSDAPAKKEPLSSKSLTGENADTVKKAVTEENEELPVNVITDSASLDELNDFFRYTKPDEPLVTDFISAAEQEHSDEFIARNITPQMRESLDFILKSNISLECLKVIEQISSENKNFVPFLKKMDKYGLTKICEITDDDDYVITTKMRIIALLNKISKNEIIHKLLRRTGALIEALKRLKELLFVNM
ncbi:MAG: hypothetical protein H7844_10870 [Nitrospirae bacterium YQR-1]